MAEPTRRPGAGVGRPLLAGVALLAAVGAFAALRFQPPAPRPAGAPPREFSAGRAADLLRGLSPDGEPHPVGSAANARIRDRILAELRRLGYAPEVQATFACGRFGFCADVENVVARLGAGPPGKALLLMTHYDGVPAGPGVSDNLVGVASLLEAARALAGGPPPPRPVVFLFTDGEEGGEIGATAFASDHRWSREIGAALNVDTRGTTGPSAMFETTGDAGWLVRRLAAALPHPVASSVFVTIYRAMPMDSDLSVFASRRVPGLNFAYIRGAAAYHTSLDDLGHTDRASLQHHGSQVLAMARSLVAADLDHPPPGDVVFFDLLGFRVVCWPEWASLPIAGLAALLCVAGAARRRSRGEISGPGAAVGLAVFIAAPLVAALLGLALQRALAATGAGARLWIAHPLPFRLAVWTSGLLPAVAAGALSSRRFGPGDLRTGIAAGWCLLALGLSALLPGASYLALLPALAFGLAGLPGALRPVAGSGAPGNLVPLLAGAVVLLPLALLLEDAGGVLVAPAVSALVALAGLPLAPASTTPRSPAPWRWPCALAGAMVAAAAVALALPAASPGSPEHMVLMLRQDAGSGRARWFVYAESGALPDAMRRAAAFGAHVVKPFDWGDLRPSFEAEAAPLPAPGPELSILERSSGDGLRRIRVRVTSPRGGREVYLVFPPHAPVAEVRIQGTRAETAPMWLRKRFGGFQMYRCLTPPPEGVEMQIGLAGPDPVDLEVVDQTPGLPPAGAPLTSARPRTAATYQEGDATYFTRTYRL